MFDIATHIEPDAVVISVEGEVDLASAGRFLDTGLQALAEAGGKPLVIDANGLQFIDSTGLNTLVRLNNAAAEAGKLLKLRGVPHRMAQVLRITALDRVLPIENADPIDNSPEPSDNADPIDNTSGEAAEADSEERTGTG